MSVRREIWSSAAGRWFLAQLAWWMLGVVLLAMPATAAMSVVELRCEFATNPLGIDVAQPRLSWQLQDDRRGARQTAWQVLVASSAELLAKEQGDLWNSGKTDTAQTTFVAYAGRPLGSSQRVFWKVRAWDAAGAATPWSEAAEWTMGMLRAEEWKAVWITSAERVENLLARTEFEAKPGLVRAVAHVSGLGHYELFLNGGKSGRDVLAPGWTDYKDTVLYDTRDVTELIRPGRNAIGLSLGNGMYHVVRPPGRFAKFVGSFGRQRAILQMRLEYADGSVEWVTTGRDWKVSPGPIPFSSIYGGEDFDARQLPEGWARAGFDDGSWAAATTMDESVAVLRGHGRAAEPVVPIEIREPIEVRELAAGVQLIDFGQNASFMPRIRVSGPKGATIKLTGGEVVNDDGTINRSTMGGAHRGSAWWSYTKATDGEETWFPQFYYLGSRYLYVELQAAGENGPRPRLEQVEMVIVHSAAEPVGHFAASDPMLGRIRELIRWAQRSNMVSILTDCPHREKLGWLEQVHLNGPALRYEWDMARLMAKTVNDMADAQTLDGLVPNIAPEYTVFKGTFRAAAEWGASFIMVPWQQYLFTGDTLLLREHYDRMKRYFAYLEGRAAGGLLNEGLGDWYDHVLGKPGRANLTPGAITATAHLYQNALTLRKIAGVLGNREEAERFSERAAAIRAVFNRELHKPESPELYGTGSHTSLALALAMGLVEEEQRERVFAALVKDIETRGHATSGAVGYRYLLQALTEGGRADLIYRLATDQEMPSYAYQLKQGSTALAESWTAQRGASQNHFFLGQILEWFYADLAGLAPDPEQPGFKHMVVKPHPIPQLTWVEASYVSLFGKHAVRWEKADGRFVLSVVVPANTTAEVHVPARDASEVMESGEPAQSQAGVTFSGQKADRVIYDLAAGEYRFEVPRRYGGETR